MIAVCCADLIREPRSFRAKKQPVAGLVGAGCCVGLEPKFAECNQPAAPLFPEKVVEGCPVVVDLDDYMRPVVKPSPLEPAMQRWLGFRMHCKDDPRDDVSIMPRHVKHISQHDNDARKLEAAGTRSHFRSSISKPSGWTRWSAVFVAAHVRATLPAF